MKTGILLTNTGTPDNIDVKSVRKYLREFLSDKRIVKLPRVLWLPILHGVVLRLRPSRSLKLYQKIWQDEGSPLRMTMEKLAERFQNATPHTIEIGMNYGNPSIVDALATLEKKEIEELIVLPLFPQYSNTSTASSYDRVMLALKKSKKMPRLNFINQYANHSAYIDALSKNIKSYWDKHTRSPHLLISFHGIPKKHVLDGDPYENQCALTAKALANALQLQPYEWTLCYQSRFGFGEWLAPSTQTILTEFPKRGIKELDIACPGFAVDCLETLEEIAITGKNLFLKSGGESFNYIPALNDSDQHIALLCELVSR